MNEPVAAAAVALKAAAMKVVANHQIVTAAMGRVDQWIGANGINFIGAELHVAERSDNGTFVPPSDCDLMDHYQVARWLKARKGH